MIKLIPSDNKNSHNLCEDYGLATIGGRYYKIFGNTKVLVTKEEFNKALDKSIKKWNKVFKKDE